MRHARLGELEVVWLPTRDNWSLILRALGVGLRFTAARGRTVDDSSRYWKIEVGVTKSRGRRPKEVVE